MMTRQPRQPLVIMGLDNHVINEEACLLRIKPYRLAGTPAGMGGLGISRSSERLPVK